MGVRGFYMPPRQDWGAAEVSINIPPEKIYEVSDDPNSVAVATIDEVPDLTYEVEIRDVSDAWELFVQSVRNKQDEERQARYQLEHLQRDMAKDQALHKLKDAFTKKGRKPGYHTMKLRELQQQWPTLYNSIQEAIRLV